MAQKLNTTEKKLKFHCSVCFTTRQLFIVHTNLLTKWDTKCLNKCLEKWQVLLINWCQEQIILDFTRKEQNKDEKQQDLTDWINQIKKNNQK